MNSYPLIPSKLLLFGEYSILAGSSAVTLPLWNFCAQLQFPETNLTPETLSSHQNLKQFYLYLNDNKEQFEAFLDLKAFLNALEKGLFLKSSIPEGYGLGSSGNVCVSIFKSFHTGFPADLYTLKKLFSRMESFFHGKSSGIDPLAIYAEKPLVFRGDQIEIPDPSGIHFQDNIYLLDSGIQRISGPFIQSFTNRTQDPVFMTDFKNRYLPVLENITESISLRLPIHWETLKRLSMLQLYFFQEMIPPAVRKLWEDILPDNDTCIKLLGAGGGGFFLLFSKKELNALQSFPLIKIQITGSIKR